MSSSSLSSSLSSRSLSNILRNAKTSSSSRTSLIATAAAGTSFSSVFSSGAAVSEPARAALFVTSGYVLGQVVMRTVFNHKTLSDVSVSCQNTEKNASVLKMLHTLRVGYDAITVLRNPHMSTVLATFLEKT